MIDATVLALSILINHDCHDISRSVFRGRGWN